MRKLLFTLLTLSLCASAKAEKIVPFKADLSQPKSACAFANLNLPKDTVVLSAGGESGGRILDYQIDQSGSSASQIDVAVNYPDKPVALMLGAYNPTIWNIGWTAKTKIVAVFATGYNQQRVAGLPKKACINEHTRRSEGSLSTIWLF